MAITNSVLLKKIEEIRKINKLAYYKLRYWYEEIKHYDKLSLKEVKKLNKLMLESTGSEKEELREKLILGTLHLVYNFVCESGTTAISTSLFDVDDIMNTSIEVWINILDEGILVNGCNRSFQTLHRYFYNRIIKLIAKGEESFDYAEEKSIKNGSIKYELGLDKVYNSVLASILEEFINLINLVLFIILNG